MVTENQAVITLLRTFPGSRLVPRLSTNPTGMDGCVRCGHSTVLIDSTGVPYHTGCKLAAVGLAGEDSTG